MSRLHRAGSVGAFPRLLTQGAQSRGVFYRSYVQTCVQREVRELLKVSDPLRFHRFLGVVAARTGQLLHYANFANAVDIDTKTAKTWLLVLEASGLVFLLQPYHRNLTKRTLKSLKLYFLDSGLAAYLTKWRTPEALEAGSMSGAKLETWAVAEIIKSCWHNGKEAPLYFDRDTDQKEMDLLVEADDVIYPIEIKKPPHPLPKPAKRLQLRPIWVKPWGRVPCFVWHTATSPCQPLSRPYLWGTFELKVRAASNPVRHRGHDFGGQFHDRLDRGGQLDGASFHGHLGVGDFIGLHLQDDGTRSRVGRRQQIHVALQMGLDLAFGLDHKTQTDFVTAQLARCKADGKRARVPKRVEPRGASIQIVQSFLRPSQVVGFFAAGLCQLGAQRRTATSQRLACVKRLRTHLAHMVDAHERPRLPAFGLVELQLGHRSSRVGAAGVRLGQECAQRTVGSQNQLVHHGSSVIKGTHGLGRRGLSMRLTMVVGQPQTSDFALCQTRKCLNLLSNLVT